MFNFIRQLPDVPMLLSMILIGLIALFVVFYTGIFISETISRIKTSVVANNIRLKRENDKLRKYIRRILGEEHHGRV